MNFRQHGRRLGYVLQEFRTDHSIESSCLKWQMLGFGLNMGPFGRGKIRVDHAQIIAFDIEEPPLGDPVASQIEYQATIGQIRHIAKMEFVYKMSSQGVCQIP